MGHNNNPYVRLGLSATLAGMTDPIELVADSIVVLQDALDVRLIEGQAHEAYDLMAEWGNLRRVQPEVFQSAGGAVELMGQARQKIQESDGFIQLALTVPNPGGWIEEAISFDASYEEVIPEEERVRWARQLIYDLDDVELVAAVAEEFGHPDAELREEIDSCRNWLKQRPELFYAVATEVQSIGQSLKPDLAVAEPQLARTVEKFIWLLNAFVQVEDELSSSRQAPFSRQEVFALFLEYQRRQQRLGQN